jgi:hypothetical protein
MPQHFPAPISISLIRVPATSGFHERSYRRALRRKVRSGDDPFRLSERPFAKTNQNGADRI